MRARGGRYRLVPHTADIGLRLEAGSWGGLLEAAARGLFKAGGAPRARGRRVEAEVLLEGGSREEILVDWLNELAYRVWGEGWLPEKVRVEPRGARRVRARLEGSAFDGSVPAREIKAASYHGLRVLRRGGVWSATVILDV